VLSAWLRWHYQRRPPLILHCRGALMTGLALDARRALRWPALRIVYDCRGLEHAEAAYGLEPGTIDEASAEALLARQRLAALQSDRVLCVSGAMAEWVRRTFGPRSPAPCVSPCCVDVGRFAAARDRRSAVRRDLGIADRLVVVYCGSVKLWQLPEQCLRLFRLVREVEPRAHFLAITTQPETMKRFIAAADLLRSDYTVVSVPHERVPDYLAAGDAGLLLRERSLVNEVASPVKFAEYLAAGLPVIVSAGVGDYSALVERYAVGVVVDQREEDSRLRAALSRFITDLRECRHQYSQRCAMLAATRLDASSHRALLAAVYAEIGVDAADAVG
jgi:glycosyltransferase involved in cell wall biosynthesis